MKICGLNEDKLLQKLPVVFSDYISEILSDIDWYNQNNTDALSKWYNYLDGMVSHISNPAIAWDNTHKYKHSSDGKTHVKELDYDVTFILKENKVTHQTYIYVLDISIDFEQLDLKDPSLMYENKERRNVIRLTESDLHAMVKECVMDLIQKRCCWL